MSSVYLYAADFFVAALSEIEALFRKEGLTLHVRQMGMWYDRCKKAGVDARRHDIADRLPANRLGREPRSRVAEDPSVLGQ
jgi:hypothetical protein